MTGGPTDELFEPLEIHPYYIAASAYNEGSAGIRVLHLLAQALIRRGMPAYVVDLGMGSVVNRAFSGPVAVPTLTTAIVREHQEMGVHPIAVYPELVPGNPLGLGTVVRYFLNYPGVLGGPPEFPDGELRLAFSRAVAGASGAEMVLCLPTSDPKVFRPTTRGHRDLVLAYAQKYRRNGGRPTLPPGAIEITSTAPSRTELPAMLARAAELHVWEDTALIVEALLSGCPVVLRPESGIEKMIMHHELGSAGVARSADRESLDVARSELRNFRERYEGVMRRAWVDLEHFITASQGAAATSAESTVTVRALRGRSTAVPVGPRVAAAFHFGLDVRSGLKRIVRAAIGAGR